jgi:hypothetical protein
MQGKHTIDCKCEKSTPKCEDQKMFGISERCKLENLHRHTQLSLFHQDQALNAQFEAKAKALYAYTRTFG